MPDRSSATPTDRVASQRARDVVGWLRGSLPALRPRADQEPAGPHRIRTTPSRVRKGMDPLDASEPANPYQHYREVKEALQRANLAFAAAVGANASSRVQLRMARRVSQLQVREDAALVAMRRHDRSWSTRGFLGVFLHSDGTSG